MELDDAIQDLLDRQALHQLAMRYARSADRRDYAGFGEIFSPEGRIAVHRGDAFGTEPLYALEGRDTIVERMRGLEQYECTNHVVSNQSVEIDGDTASGETYCMAHHLYREDGIAMDLTMAVRYQDRFVRRAGRWLFSERRLAVDWERRLPLGKEGWLAETHA
jgi:hypothetical protein